MGSGPTGINSGTKTPPRLCYHALPSQRPEPLGMMTPPLQAPGSVPFRWEEAPGKPLSRFSDDAHRPKPAAARCLEPPPGMAVLSSASSAWQVAKVADADVPPKTVLEGPYYVLLHPPASLFDGPSVIARQNSLSCSSFTIGERSLRYYGVGEGGKRRERSAVWFWKRAARRGDEESAMGKIEDGPAAACNLSRSYSSTATKCYLDHGEGAYAEGSTGGGCCCVHEGGAPPPRNVRITRFRRTGSLPNLSTATTHLWATIYGGLKQMAMAPWRSSRKSASKRWSHDPDH